MRGVRRHRGVPRPAGGRRRRGGGASARSWEQRRSPPGESAGVSFDQVCAGFGFDWLLGRGLGLQRLEQPQRPPQLGERAAAVAQQRVEGARAVAVADQREAEVAVATAFSREQVGLDALGALKTPGGRDDPLREQALQRALGRQLFEQRRLERIELARALLARQHEVFGREDRA